jgi:uncharacterized protein DUF3486
MPGLSDIELMPRTQREEIERLWLDGGYKRVQLHAHLKSLGFNVTYGGLCRHVKKLDRRMERYREAQAVSDGWIKRLSGQPDAKIARLLLEMLQMVSFRHLADLGDDQAEQTPKPAEIAVLAKALKQMEATASAIADREIKLREELKSELDRKAEAMKRKSAGDEVATLERAKQLVRGLL